MPFRRSRLCVCGTANPLWISLEGFLEESVLNLNVKDTGLAPAATGCGD